MDTPKKWKRETSKVREYGPFGSLNKGKVLLWLVVLYFKCDSVSEYEPFVRLISCDRPSSTEYSSSSSVPSGHVSC